MSLRNTSRPAALVGVLSILILAFSAAPKAEAQQTCDFVAGFCQSPIDECPSESELETKLTCTGGLKCCAPSACVDRGGTCVTGVSACPADTTFLGKPADCSGTTGRCCTPPPAPTPTPTPVACNNDATCQPGEPCSCADCSSAPQCQGGSSAYKVEFLHTDALGSVRMVTDQAGAVVSRADYYPFGGQIGTDVNGRLDASIPGYAEDPNLRQRFTGKERDGESQLDYFGARYYSGAQGRFTSPDPGMDPGRLIGDPQGWNRYSYTRNNPLRRVDPDGREDVEALAEIRQLQADRNAGAITEGQYRAELNARAAGTLAVAVAVAGQFRAELAYGVRALGAMAYRAWQRDPNLPAKAFEAVVGPPGTPSVFPSVSFASTDMALGVHEGLGAFAGSARTGSGVALRAGEDLMSGIFRGIQETVKSGGTIRFSLKGVDVDGALTRGSKVYGTYTSRELRYILGDEVLRANTVFYDESGRILQF